MNNSLQPRLTRLDHRLEGIHLRDRALKPVRRDLSLPPTFSAESLRCCELANAAGSVLSKVSSSRASSMPGCRAASIEHQTTFAAAHQVFGHLRQIPKTSCWIALP